MTYHTTIFTALADPTRRAIFEKLAEGKSSVAGLARTLPISQPAVSQHLKVLRSAGLVGKQAEGARNIYSITPAGLSPLRQWLSQFWDDQLEAFKQAAERDGENK